MKTTARRLKSVKEYYFSSKLREVAARVKAGQPIINMGIGSPDLPAHPSVIAALKKSLSHPRANITKVIRGFLNFDRELVIFIKHIIK